MSEIKPESGENSASSISGRVESELVGLVYKEAVAGITATLAVVVLFSIVMGQVADPRMLIGWLAFMVVILALRFLLVRKYNETAPIADEARVWANRFTIGVALTGLGWGLPNILFFPIEGEIYDAFYVFIIAGISAAAVPALAPVLVSCWIYTGFTVLPLAIRYMLFPDAIHPIMGVILLVYFGFIVVTASQYRKTTVTALRLGMENNELVRTLTEAKDRAEALNRDLMEEIQQRKSIETDLRQEKERADAANQAKSEFLATMSHEIRTPMNGVLGMCQILKDSALEPDQQHYLEIAMNSAESLLAILNDILDFSRIEVGRLKLENVEFNLTETIEDVVGLMRGPSSEKGLSIRSEIDAAVPEKAVADPVRVRQILTNLLSNAVKFTHDGEVVLSVNAGERNDGKVLLSFAVRDTGVGMKEETLERLFQPFTQGDGTLSRKYGGTGLGLAISRQLVEMMEGEFEVESTFGEGSIFTVILPMSVEYQLDSTKENQAT